ncbi:transmembrane protein, putative (macronuclear) [Tetrahymena thermophila SB210]|uniref:Transmembrane protein, putative n=1 Tax=Tetrahymena thermophila (strain SB210) TaxID=312017 RepID=Q233L5_TETTS|nr:transmembrane protein, putative [Tetrahymena thermophila SB210]EAR91565.2 transmembrane protein, putative [Tetrahymena thermophila SB210]|eukprot:XP_001011810.2 transmembrane protein, putative [Tetrahymena thermophila SB210]
MRKPCEVELVLQLEFYYLKDLEKVLKNEKDYKGNDGDNYEFLYNRIQIVNNQLNQKGQIFNGLSLFYQYLFTPNENGLSDQTIGVDKDYLKLYEKRQEENKKKLINIEIGCITKGLIHNFFFFIKLLCFIFMIITLVLVILQYFNFQVKNEQAFNYMKKYSNIIFVILFDFECNSIQLLKSYRNSLKRLTQLLIYDRSEENRQNYDISSYELPCINLFSLKSINTWYNLRKLTFQQNIANKNIIMLHCLLEFTTTLTLIILFWPTLYSFYTVQTECEGQSLSSTNLVVLIILFYRIIIKSLYEVVSFFCEINSSYYEHLQILQDITSALKQTLDKYSKLEQNYKNGTDQINNDEIDQNHPTILYFQFEAVKQIKKILKYKEHKIILDQLEYQLIDLKQKSQFDSNQRYNLNFNRRIDLRIKEDYVIMKYEDIKWNLNQIKSIFEQQGRYVNNYSNQSDQQNLQQEKKYLKQLIQQYEIIIKDLEEHQKENQLYFLNIIPINKDQLSGFIWIFVPLLLSVLLKLFKKGNFSFIKDVVDEIWRNLT